MMDYKKSFHKLLFIFFLLCIDTGLSIIQDEDYFDEPSFNRCPWIRNKLKNGRVRYRYKGRVAKFLCDSGFELAGKRSSTCVRGQWSNPVPVCVARGCPRVPSISNGRITEMYRGALLVYDCNPGYVLDGDPQIHCDGRRWNTSPPLCAIATETPETYCDFENPDLCGWSHDPTHDFDWQRNQFSTPSGHVGTGPAFDHTFGENKAGFYLFIEASSPRKINDTARLFSPVYSQDLSGGCFIFWYHMYGATTGGLRVYLKPESHVFDELKPNWQKYGDQGNQWLKGHMIVPVLHENFQIVIEGVRGESYVGDSAIDDVRLTTNLCDSDDNSTDKTESVDQYSCRGRCQESGTESSCGCNANCVDEPNFCCRDYYTICTAGNSTAIQNTDEPLPEDFTTTSLVDSQQTTFTKFQPSEEPYINTTHLQTEKQELTSDTISNSPSTFTSTSVSSSDKIPTKDNMLSTTQQAIEISSPETSTSIKTSILTTITPSTMLKTEASSSSTTSSTIKTTKYVSPDISTAITSTLPTTTSLKTTVISTTPTTLTPVIPLTTVPTTEQTTTSGRSETTTFTTRTSTLTTTTTPESTTQKSTVTESSSNFTSSIKSISSLPTYSYTSSTLAATISNRTSTSLSTITTFLSTRKTYNLRPRNRTTSTIVYTTLPITKSTVSASATNTTIKESIPDYSVTTSPSHLTSWYRYSISTSSKQQSSPSSPKTTATYIQKTSTKNPLTSEAETLNSPKTTKIPSRFTKSTESSLPKHSDIYESKSKTSSSNSSIPVIVSILIIIIICLVAGTAYYMRKQRSKRQSKLSDDSEMRFLPESDYMEYSDSSALDRILIK